MFDLLGGLVAVALAGWMVYIGIASVREGRMPCGTCGHERDAHVPFCRSTTVLTEGGMLSSVRCECRDWT